MHVEKDVTLDPGIGAVQVEHVVARAREDVIVELDDSFAEVPIATGEIHNVVVPGGSAKEAVAHYAAPACFDAGSAVDQLERGRAAGENAMTDQERTAVQGEVLVGRGPEGGVVQVESATSDLDAGVAVAFEEGVSDAGLG